MPENLYPKLLSQESFNIETVRKYYQDIANLKGQLQRFHKLSLFVRFRHVENGFDINF